MLQILRNLAQRYNDWCGDRDMEVSIRKHISQEGYFGNTAKLRNVRLVAVQRPGWIQVFRFEATARRVLESNDEGPDAEAQYEDLIGLVREDMRKNSSVVMLFANERARSLQFADWSQDLICLRGAQGLADC